MPEPRVGALVADEEVVGLSMLKPSPSDFLLDVQGGPRPGGRGTAPQGGGDTASGARSPAHEVLTSKIPTEKPG